MTPKEAKEYLIQYRQSLVRTGEIEAHLRELKEEAVSLKNHEGYSVALDEATALYVDACDEKAAELRRLESVRREIEELIDSVNDIRLRELLREIYISGRKLVRIAADRDQSYEHICRLHGEALLEVCRIKE